jgi:hypothetical protein
MNFENDDLECVTFAWHILQSSLAPLRHAMGFHVQDLMAHILSSPPKYDGTRTLKDSVTNRLDPLGTNVDDHDVCFFGASFFCLQNLFFNSLRPMGAYMRPLIF